VVQDNALLPPTAILEDRQPIDRGMAWQWPAKDYRKPPATFFRPTAHHPVHALRIWHRPDTNRILAMRAEEMATFKAFDRICRSYGAI
jgi:hypothetical protein